MTRTFILIDIILTCSQRMPSCDYIYGLCEIHGLGFQDAPLVQFKIQNIIMRMANEGRTWLQIRNDVMAEMQVANEYNAVKILKQSKMAPWRRFLSKYLFDSPRSFVYA